MCSMCWCLIFLFSICTIGSCSSTLNSILSITHACITVWNMRISISTVLHHWFYVEDYHSYLTLMTSSSFSYFYFLPYYFILSNFLLSMSLLLIDARNLYHHLIIVDSSLLSILSPLVPVLVLSFSILRIFGVTMVLRIFGAFILVLVSICAIFTIILV